MLKDRVQFNTDSQSFHGWIDRAEKCADLISSIRDLFNEPPILADVGCGDEKLRSVLQRLEGGVEYQGYDLYPQSSSVKRFDARYDLLSCDYDIIVSLGLTEYIELANFFVSIRKHCRFFIVSHVLRDLNQYSEADLKRLGWVNHLSSDEFERELVAAGFGVVRSILTSNKKTKIWLCS